VRRLRGQALRERRHLRARRPGHEVGGRAALGAGEAHEAAGAARREDHSPHVCARRGDRRPDGTGALLAD